MRGGSRRALLAGVALLAVATVLAAPRAPVAQPDPRIPWIGYLANEPTTDSAPVLRDGLRERDWVEGQSVKIWYRYVQGKPELYPQHAEDLARLSVAVIVAVGPEAIEAARQATKTIPIVMVSLDDLAAGGLTAETKDPSTNLTGITTFVPELAARRLDLLREVVPRLARAAVLWRSAGASAAADLRATHVAASARGVKLTPVEITGDSDVREALTEIGKLRPQGLIVLADAVALAHRQRLATFASRAKLPAVYSVAGLASGKPQSQAGPRCTARGRAWAIPCMLAIHAFPGSRDCPTASAVSAAPGSPLRSRTQPRLPWAEGSRGCLTIASSSS